MAQVREASGLKVGDGVGLVEHVATMRARLTTLEKMPQINMRLNINSCDHLNAQQVWEPTLASYRCSRCGNLTT